MSQHQKRISSRFSSQSSSQNFFDLIALQDLNETLTVLKMDNNIFTELGTGDSGGLGSSGLFHNVPGGKETFPLMTKLIELNLDDCRIQGGPTGFNIGY